MSVSSFATHITHGSLTVLLVLNVDSSISQLSVFGMVSAVAPLALDGAASPLASTFNFKPSRATSLASMVGGWGNRWADVVSEGK